MIPIDNERNRERTSVPVLQVDKEKYLEVRVKTKGILMHCIQSSMIFIVVLTGIYSVATLIRDGTLPTYCLVMLAVGIGVINS